MPMLLSIAIATRNRSSFLIETLDSITSAAKRISQQEKIEVVIVDGSSNTKDIEVIKRHLGSYLDINLTYELLTENGGLDRDYIRAFEKCSGDFVWFMSDDDLLEPDAFVKLYTLLRPGIDMCLVNSALYSSDFGKLLDANRFKQREKIISGLSQVEIFQYCAPYLAFLPGLVVNRHFYNMKLTDKYNGSYFAHLGILFGSEKLPKQVVCVKDPILKVRGQNASWAPNAMKIWLVKFPKLIWSFDHFNDEALSYVTKKNPALSLRRIMWERALGNIANCHLDSETRNYIGIFGWILIQILSRIPQHLLCAFLIYLFTKLDIRHHQRNQLVEVRKMESRKHV